MKQIEEAAVQSDLTWARLMENAGSAAAAFLRRTFPPAGLNCLVFCGSGNNGGDGFVVARRMFENGANVLAVLVEGRPKSEHAAGMLANLELMQIPLLYLADDLAKIETCLEHADIVVDAICGTGFYGELSESAAYACHLTNNAIAAVVSLDIPTGVECDTGAVAKGAVKPDFTITFDSLKPAHLLAKDACGQVEVVDIGIPQQAHEGIDYLYSDIMPKMVWKHLPPRDPNSHKGSNGRVLIICGSGEYRGAAVLAAKAAMRAGAGLCCVASVEPVCAAIATTVPEAILLPLEAARHGGIDNEAAADIVARKLKWADAVVFGPGLGNTADTRLLLEHLLPRVEAPIIIDADGINALSVNIHLLKEAQAPVIITPHPGEMSRLCGKSVKDIEADRALTAIRFAAANGCVVTLKGPRTLIAAGGGGLLTNTTGNAGLAKGGAGDVLAGMIGAFAARGVSSEWSAACAVYLHGLAADRLAERKSQFAMLPSELPDALGEIFVENGR
jgi:NAD(P)H-hydrate epimerase